MAKKRVELLLRKQVKDLGTAGELVTVSAGYARNFLLANDLADLATPALKAQYQKQQEHQKAQDAQAIATARALAKKLEGLVVTVRVKAGQKGKLFGSVSAEDISKAVQDQYQVAISAKNIGLKQPLKELGKHSVAIALAKNVPATLTVQIVSSKS